MSCPFCGDNNLDIQPVTYWTGMRYNTLSYRGLHFCSTEGFDKVSISFRGHTEEDIKRLFDRRS